MSEHFDMGKLALHLHDTYGQALGSVYAGLEAGVRCFDASIAGLGVALMRKVLAAIWRQKTSCICLIAADSLRVSRSTH